ncbi:hypothetical protein EI77_03468 [Prosthecobacter fusiformis]|uniref:Uncharacterized protein n=1 Tax=Prosthecobacter fusiformis TaxID=48464 RepID=A0A4R7RRA4_9BACT|nr:hypothetical protein [Prosthecobacter fusiformis]TDU67266.1 hypothetical protein EI77_03468 [Prosthecobacter fusiformis]
MKTSNLQEKQGEYQTKPVILDGHRYAVDPMSDSFTEVLVACFAEGKKKALARKAGLKAFSTGKKRAAKPVQGSQSSTVLRAAKSPARRAGTAAKTLRKKTKEASKNV